MTEPTPITIPLINPNEPTARLAALNVTNGQHITKGDRIGTLETTKATQDLVAEGEGYLVGLVAKEGQDVQFGEILAYLSASPDWIPPAHPGTPSQLQGGRPEGLRISQAALALAEQHHLDLSHFSSEVFITEKMVQEIIDRSAVPEPVLPVQHYQPSDILIYGGGGHGKILIDLMRALATYSIAGIVDDGLPAGSEVMGVPVLGGANSLAELRKRGLQLAANAVGGIGNISSRITVFERLDKAGFICPSLVHPTAYIESSSTLAEGVQVMPHVYVGSETQVGFGVILNTGAIVSHDCILGDYTNLSPGAILAGEVNVGKACLIGMGATINLRVKIGAGARIGNGATVKLDVPEGGIVRAGTIWPD